MKKITSFFFSMLLTLSVVNAQDITVFDFDGVTPATDSWSDSFVGEANPLSDGVNSSANSGKYTHTNQWSNVTIAPVSIDPRVYPSFEVSVYSPASTTGSVVVACYNGDKQIDWYSQSITTAGAWTKFIRNLSSTTLITKVIVGFNFGGVPAGNTNDVVYFDNLVFKKTTNPFLTLYSETFFASWSEWGPWTGAPSTQAGKWFGGVNLETAGDAPITLDRWWDGPVHLLKLSTTDVIIPNINVAGFDSLKFSSDMLFDSIAASELPIVDIKVGAGDWVPVVTSAITGEWSWSNQVILLKDGSGNPINNVSTISIRLSNASAGFAFFDNVKITGKVHSVISSLSNELKNVFTVYPNPAADYIITRNTQKVTITDLNGRIVKEAYNTEKVDVHSLANGVYIVKATIDNIIKIGKLIKEL